MVSADPTAARWTTASPGRGHYESYYLRAVDPARRRGIWIRYTVTVAPGGRAGGQLWFTFFDRDAPHPRAVRVDVGEPMTGDGCWIRFGDSRFGPTEITGAATSPERSASWTLRHSSDEAPLWHLPRSWMYTARLPRTKLLSPSPTTVFDGTVEVDGETVDVSGWTGMVGHNWGEQHAEQWIWLSGLGFEGCGADTWLDVAIGRVRLGPVTTPWIANGAVSLDGRRLALGGLGRRTTVIAADDRCTLRIPGPEATVTASVSAPPEAFVEWDYANPDGSMHRVVNCSVADLSMTVARKGGEPIELRADGRAAYELGRH